MKRLIKTELVLDSELDIIVGGDEIPIPEDVLAGLPGAAYTGLQRAFGVPGCLVVETDHCGGQTVNAPSICQACVG